MSITDVLNVWNQAGVFAYVLPFLLIFALVFAIIQRSKLFAQKEADNKYKHNNAIEAIIAAAVALLALQFDTVSVFFANIFPKFGIGLSIFLVLIIFIGFFYNPRGANDKKKVGWIGWVVGIGVVIWALSNWNVWFGGFGFGWWFQEYFWSLIILAIVIGAIILAVRGNRGSTG